MWTLSPDPHPDTRTPELHKALIVGTRNIMMPYARAVKVGAKYIFQSTFPFPTGHLGPQYSVAYKSKAALHSLFEIG